MKKEGVVALESLEGFNELEREYDKLSKEIRKLEEDEVAIKEKLKELVDKRFKIQQEDMYDAAIKAVDGHMYWAVNTNFHQVAKIDKRSPRYYVRFLVTGKKGVDIPHSSSPVGVIYNYPIPITEEKYNEVRNYWVEKLGKKG